ncbi:MAG TPA: serine hydrolase [Thermomicrobiales bacterium]|nr:serine hydrolase [Thermomicrobiales bacterium]
MTFSPPSAPRVLFAVLTSIFLLAGIWVSPTAALEPPAMTAAGVYAYDLETGIVLYEKNADDRRQVGSTVKVATALTVMKYGNPEDEVVIEKDDTVDITLYSNMQLVAGDTLTVGTLLFGLLLPSGNDAALALARHVGYDLCNCDDATAARSAFVDAMNEMATELGLTNTHFENPDGIDHDSAYSSAHDMAILFGELMKNERLASIVAEPAYSFWSVGKTPRNYTGVTTNQLLGTNGVVGGKTGTTSEAGACVVLARQVAGSDATVITAILGADVEYDDKSFVVEGSDQRWNDANSLFADMDQQFSWVVPGADGTFPGLDEEMAVWQVSLAGSPLIPYPAEGVTASYQLVLGEGDTAGAVHLFFDEQQVGSVPVESAAASTGGGR